MSSPFSGIFGDVEPTPFTPGKKMNLPMSARKETFDFRKQDEEQENKSSASGLKRVQNLEPQTFQSPDRKGGVGGLHHPANATSACIFPKPKPREEPKVPLDVLQSKLKSGAALTAEERTAALYNPHLFHQNRTIHREYQARPWQIGMEPAVQNPRRRVASPKAGPEATDTEELFNEGGRKKHGYQKTAFDQTEPGPALPGNFSGRRHYTSSPTPTQEWFKSPKKHVKAVRTDSVNLKIDEPSQEQTEAIRFAKKRLGDKQKDQIDLRHTADQAAADAAAAQKTGRKILSNVVEAAAHRSPLRGGKVHSQQTVVSSRCPFGTEYAKDQYVPYRSGVVSRESMKVSDAPKASGLRTTARPKDHPDMFTW